MQIESEGRVYALAALGLGLLVLGVTGDALLASGDFVVSSERGDVAYYFARIRAFGFGEIARGNLPLWNPYLFAGTPLLGGFQVGLLYPPNLLYAALPLAKAINLDVALHLFLTGFFAFAWVRQRRIHPLGAFFAGVLAMLGGACAMRVMAGQVSLLAGNAWTPLVLLCLDRLLDRASLGWCPLGIAAVSLQVLAGYPFCVFATALVAGAYTLMRLPRCTQRRPKLGALAALAVAPLGITAVQLWTGFDTAAESTRAGGVSLLFAQSHSIPLENLITILVPAFFGDLIHVNYWGRWWIWDVSIFLGAPALVLAILGVHFGKAEQIRFSSLLALALLVVALGSETPLHELLYRFVPGFDRFRAPSKFAFHASLFVAMLAGIGVDHLQRSARGARPAALLAALGSAALIGLGFWIRRQAFGAKDGGAWSDIVLDIGSHWVHTPEFVAETAAWASRGLGWAAASTAALALLLALRPRQRLATTLIVVLASAELVGFARIYRAGFSLSEVSRTELTEFVRARSGDHRFLVQAKDSLAQDNQALEDRFLSLWGYDPVQLERYARLILSVRKGRAEPAPDSLQFDGPTAYHPAFRLLRGRYSFLHAGDAEHPGALPRFALLRNYDVLEPEEALSAIIDPGFDPHGSVVLERQPDPPPDPQGSAGQVTLLDESTDHVTLQVELDAAAILLISDAYSRGWRARPVGASSQPTYRVLPADFVLRAIPLAAGSHLLRVEYAPASYRIGRWISAASTAAFAGVVVLTLRRRPGRARAGRSRTASDGSRRGDAS